MLYIIVDGLCVVTVLSGIPTTSLKIVQQGEPYEFNLSLRIITDKGEVTKALEIIKENETFEIASNRTPSELVFDGDYDLMRSLRKMNIRLL